MKGMNRRIRTGLLFVSFAIVLVLTSRQLVARTAGDEPFIDHEVTDVKFGRDGDDLTITPIVRVVIKGGEVPDIGITIQVEAEFADGTLVQNAPDTGFRMKSNGRSCAADCADGVRCSEVAGCPALQLFSMLGPHEVSGRCALVADSRSADEQGRTTVGSCDCVYSVEAASPIKKALAEVAPGQRVIMRLDPNEFEPEFNEENNTREFVIPGDVFSKETKN